MPLAQVLASPMQHISSPAVRSLADARAPRIGSVELAFPKHHYGQRELIQALEARWGASEERERVHALVEKLHRSVAVEGRYLALSVEEHSKLRDFGDSNDAFIRIGTELGAEAVTRAVARAGLELEDIDAIFFTTVTGVAAPSIDARLVNRLRLRRDIRRTPMFGLGCLGGAAGIARTNDYLRGNPDHVAVFLSVELCSLTLQRDFSLANIVSSGLFGDGAGAVVMMGADHGRSLEAATRTSSRTAGSSRVPASLRSNGSQPARPSLPFSIRDRVRPRVVATKSAFFPDTERVMGWDVGASGFKVVLSADVPKIVRENLPQEVDAFLAEHGLARSDIRHWVCHPGGPKVISAIEEALSLAPDALAITRHSLATVGNLSSASVLHVLAKTQERARPGELGVLMAMGPGFCAEMVLLAWQASPTG
jgi:alkylresorcinol/alkylpyrone synthase